MNDQADPIALVMRHPMLARLHREVLESLLAQSRLVPYRAGRPVLREGAAPEHVYCLIEGAVRVFHRNGEGEEILVKLFKAPALFGEMEVLVGSRFLEHVSTIEPSRILHVPAAWFRRLVETDASFCRALVVDLSARLCIATQNERALAFLDADSRIANLLLDYASVASRPDGDGLILEVRLTQDGIARDLALSRKTVTRTLQRFRTEGIISKRGGRYVLHDLPGLEARSTHRASLSYRLP